MGTTPKTIDENLAALPADQRGALKKLRTTIKTIEPEAQECISYSMPAFRVGGRVVAGFRATSKGCSYYPFSGRTLATLAAHLTGYEQTKSALHFTPEHPLPKALVKTLLKARIAETALPRAAPARASTRTAAARHRERAVRSKSRAGG
jgi:uncharacterized protein YdhG (YjbR/CyaY superfamily)